MTITYSHVSIGPEPEKKTCDTVTNGYMGQTYQKRQFAGPF